MPYFLRHELGRAGAIAASVLLVISPAFLYFSRFIRHDIYVDVFTLLMVIGVFRYLATGKRSWFYTACVSAALLFATKEDFYISGFILFVFLVGSWFLLQRRAAAAVPRAGPRPRRPVVGHRRWRRSWRSTCCCTRRSSPTCRACAPALVTPAAERLRRLHRRAQLLARASRTSPAAASPGSTTSCCCRCTSSCR